MDLPEGLLGSEGIGSVLSEKTFPPNSKSVGFAYQAIKSGDATAIVAGGQECMSQAPHVINIRNGIKLNDAEMKDSMVFDGLTDAFHNIHMGITAENIAKKWSISRLEQDEYAYQSQVKTAKAQEGGYFDEEIVPVVISTRKGDVVVAKDEYPKANTSVDALQKLRPVFQKDGTVTAGNASVPVVISTRKGDVVVAKDEYPKANTTVEALQKLRPVFQKDGTVTAGNASGINDGAAAVLLMSYKRAQARNIQPLARIVAMSSAGVEPTLMGPTLFQVYEVNINNSNDESGDTVMFQIPFIALLQCLTIFDGCSNTPGATSTLKMTYRGYGHPLNLILEEEGVLTDCQIRTQEAIDVLNFVIRDDEMSFKIIMKALELKLIFAELDSSSEYIELKMSSEPQNMKIVTRGDSGMCEVCISSSSEFVDIFSLFFLEKERE
ncbi:uncharacterized protein LOC103515471 [Diaphorina citri]|uniref:Uncharacterized protein LOC103515471 n=1 Tax=Diaphorina citri TaxID=121845 RepID=A0A3Q0J664_DIACI|nr:uncharacterized protein LOC103515471 [Diaphorina citri]